MTEKDTNISKEKTDKVKKIKTPSVKKKKIKKNILSGVAFIKSTFNNTIISISDDNGLIENELGRCVIDTLLDTHIIEDGLINIENLHIKVAKPDDDGGRP